MATHGCDLSHRGPGVYTQRRATYQKPETRVQGSPRGAQYADCVIGRTAKPGSLSPTTQLKQDRPVVSRLLTPAVTDIYKPSAERQEDAKKGLSEVNNLFLEIEGAFKTVGDDGLAEVLMDGLQDPRLDRVFHGKLTDSMHVRPFSKDFRDVKGVRRDLSMPAMVRDVYETDGRPIQLLPRAQGSDLPPYEYCAGTVRPESYYEEKRKKEAEAAGLKTELMRTEPTRRWGSPAPVLQRPAYVQMGVGLSQSRKGYFHNDTSHD